MRTEEIPRYWTCLKQVNVEDGPILVNYSHRSHPRFQVTFVSVKWVMDEEEMGDGEWFLESWEISGPKLSKVDQRHLPTKTSIRKIDGVQIPDAFRTLIEDSKP